MLIAANVFADPSSNKSIIFEKNRSNFNQENFLLDYFSIDWKALLKIEQQNINFFFSKINSLFDTHVPLKKICQYKLKFKTKPWMTPDLQKSVAVFTLKHLIKNYMVKMSTKNTRIYYPHF